LRLWDTSLPPPTDADPNPSGATRVVAYSPDGKMLLSGHGSEWWPVPGSLHWWESDSGRRIRSIHGPWLPTSVYVTGDAKSPRAIVAGVEQARRNQSRSMITSWNWGEGGLAPAANHLNLDPASVQENVNLASCNDWFLVYGSRPSLSARPRVYLFDGVGPAQKANFVLPGGTCVAAFSPDGRWLAVSGHIDNTIKPMKGVPIDRRIPIRLYETATLVGLTVPETMKNGPPKEIRQIGESTTNVSALAFTTDSKGVIVADAVGRLRLLDIAGGKPVELQGAATPSKALSLLTLSADGQLLAGCGRNGHVFVMNLATKRTVLSRHLPGPVYGVAFSPAADQLALAAGNGSTWILPLRK
jgi:WD40 repeat protein